MEQFLVLRKRGARFGEALTRFRFRQNRSQRLHVQERHVGHPKFISITNIWATRPEGVRKIMKLEGNTEDR
jgi:hypothetical protein